MEELNNLYCKIRYQLPTDTTTWGNCFNGCGNRARGSKACISCLQAELAKLVPINLARNYISSAQSEYYARLLLIGHIESKSDEDEA